MRCTGLVVALALAAAAWGADSPELSQVRNVYLLPMANGVDQYLANKLTRTGVFRVVTDPQLADAIFTESTGPGFEDKLNELYPPPGKDKDKDKDKDKKETAPAKESEPAFGNIKNADEPRDIFRPKVSAWARGKGNLFLVGRQSHAILWSVFDQPKDNRPRSLDRMAETVVKKLTSDLKRTSE